MTPIITAVGYLGIIHTNSRKANDTVYDNLATKYPQPLSSKDSAEIQDFKNDLIRIQELELKDFLVPMAEKALLKETSLWRWIFESIGEKISRKTPIQTIDKVKSEVTRVHSQAYFSSKDGKILKEEIDRIYNSVYKVSDSSSSTNSSEINSALDQYSSQRAFVHSNTRYIRGLCATASAVSLLALSAGVYFYRKPK